MSYPFNFHILCFIQLHLEVETQKVWMELVSVADSLENEQNLRAIVRSHFMSYNPPPKVESNFNFSETRRNFSPNTGTDFYTQIQKIGAIGVVELSETPLEHGC